jgi:hypothetical protein
MARYYIHVDDDQSTVLRELLEQADDPRTVVYLPGEGPNGAVELPDTLAESYQSSAAAQAKADRDAEVEKYAEADARTRVAPGPDDPTLEDLREPGQKTNVVAGTYEAPAPTAKRASSRKATKTEE